MAIVHGLKKLGISFATDSKKAIIIMNFKKVSSTILWRDSLTVALGIIASIETLFALTDFGLNDYTSINEWWKRALIIVGIFLLIWITTACIKAYRANKKVVLKIRGIKVTIKVGDIFKSTDLKLIPFNEFYDTKVDDIVIAHNSLNGKFITDHVPNVEDLQATITQAGDVYGLKHKIIGGRNAFPLGRIIVYKDYMLLSFSHFVHNQANLTHKDYEGCLRTMWKEISRTYANRPITLPLLGGGITRFEDISEKNESHLLRCLLCTLKTSNAKIYQPITVVLTKEAMDNINLYEIKKIF
jgi:hypothetical protein